MENLETYIPNSECLGALILTIELAGEPVKKCITQYVYGIAKEISDDTNTPIDPEQIEKDIEALTAYVEKEMSDFDDYVDSFQEAREDDTRQRIRDLKSEGY